MPTREAIDSVPVQLHRCTNFSAKNTGVQDLLDTAPTPFMPMFLIVMLRAVSGFTSVPTISIGTNAPNYNNIVPATALTALDAVGEYFRVPIGTAVGTGGVFRGMAPESSVSVKANVTVAAVATTYDIEVQIVGAYV
jgi:hypothetical protein